MSTGLIHALAEHPLGNYRVLPTLAAAQFQRPQLDAHHYPEVFAAPGPAARKRA